MAGKDLPVGTRGLCLTSLPGWPFPSFPTPLPNIPFPCQGSPSQEPPFPQDPSSSPQDLLHPLLSGPLRLPWSQVLAFAAAVAQDGFNVTHDLGQWGLEVGGRYKVNGEALRFGPQAKGFSFPVCTSDFFLSLSSLEAASRQRIWEETI